MSKPAATGTHDSPTAGQTSSGVAEPVRGRQVDLVRLAAWGLVIVACVGVAAWYRDRQAIRSGTPSGPSANAQPSGDAGGRQTWTPPPPPERDPEGDTIDPHKERQVGDPGVDILKVTIEDKDDRLVFTFILAGDIPLDPYDPRLLSEDDPGPDDSATYGVLLYADRVFRRVAISASPGGPHVSSGVDLKELPNFDRILGMTREMGPFVDGNRIWWEIPKVLLPDLSGGYAWKTTASHSIVVDDSGERLVIDDFPDDGPVQVAPTPEYVTAHTDN